MVHEILGNADSNPVLSQPAYSRFIEVAAVYKNRDGNYKGSEANLSGRLFQELTYDFLREHYRDSMVLTEDKLSDSLKTMARRGQYGVISADQTQFCVKDYRSSPPRTQNIGLPDAMVIDESSGLFEIRHIVEAKLRFVKPIEQKIKGISQQAKNLINFLRTERGERVFFEAIGKNGTLLKPDYSDEIFLRMCPLQETPIAFKSGVKFQAIPYKREDIHHAAQIFLMVSASEKNRSA